MMKNEEGIFSALDLACYICEEYEKFTNYSKEITSIKLQKSLYFLFAYWGGFVRKSKSTPYVEEELNENELLFNNQIQAWVYGPVVPEVYRAFRNNILKSIGDSSNVYNELSENELLKDTFDSLLDDIFKTSDFKLVTLSHKDKCWINNFEPTEEKHDKEIYADEIISEYAAKC